MVKNVFVFSNFENKSGWFQKTGFGGPLNMHAAFIPKNNPSEVSIRSSIQIFKQRESGRRVKQAERLK